MTYYHLYTNGLITSSDELIETHDTQFIDAFRLQGLSESNDLLVCNIDTFKRATVLAVAFGLTPSLWRSSDNREFASLAYIDSDLESIENRLANASQNASRSVRKITKE